MGRAAKGLSKTQQDWINQGRSLIQAAPTFSKNDYPWRDEDLEFFTPQPLEKFLYEEMGGIVLFPKQREDLEALLGVDPKQMFESGIGLPQQALLAYGKGCLGADEKLKDHASGVIKTVEGWAADGRSLLLPSWDGHKTVLRQTSPVYLKGSAQLYRVTLEDGRSFVATAHHKCLSPFGWLHVGDFDCGYTYIKSGFRDHEYALVRSREPIRVGDFYDLTVPITHNYIDDQGICHSNSGKDFVVSCFMIWSCHVLLCLKDIPVYLGQAPGENIDVLTVAYSMDQAKSVLFYKMKARLRACPWFNQAIAHLVPNISPERYLKDGNGFVGADSILFPGNLRLWSVPATDAAEGKNPILWCADEIAAFSSPVRMNQASHIHKILTTSARTRFGDRWKGLLLSYARHSQDYIMKLIAQSRQGKAPGLYVAVRPTWEVNLNVTRESLQPDYDLNPEDSACRYECNPPSAVDAYFRNPELLLLHAKGAPIDLLKAKLDLPDEQLQEIANKGRSPLLEIDGSGDPILDMRGFPKLARWWVGQKDLAGQEYEYYVHLDPGATGDSFGFAIGHNHQRLDGSIMPTIDLAFRWVGRMFHEFGEIHRQQWFPNTMAQTEIVTAAEIDFRTVREFIFFLRYARSFNIRQISMDNWNSVESRQELDKRGFQCIVRIVAKQDYDIWKGLVYSRQIAYYGYPILIEENYKLQLLHGAKVDAPRTKEGEGMKADSHKDVSDAVAAVARYLNFLKDEGIEFYTAPGFTDMGRELWDKDELENPTPLVKEESDLTAPTLHSQVWDKFMTDED